MPENVLHFHLIGLNCRFSHSCLALFYVRNELHRNLPRAKINLHQWTINDPYYETLLRISRVEADALFFSVYIWNAGFIGRLIGDLKAVQPEIPIIIGGPQATSMTDLPAHCTVVDGEIEGIGEDFYRDLENGQLKSRYTAMQGCFFSAPYVDDDFSGPLRNRQVYYESSRGCPFHCSYCLSSLSKGVLHHDIDRVRRELNGILEHQPKIIKFVDRTFNDNPTRALSIWRYLGECDAPTRFHFEIAPDRFSEEMFQFLATVPPGRFQFEIGIQSTNLQTLNAINRKMDVGRALANIARLAGIDNIHLHVDLILGLPYETEESFRDSFNRVFSPGAHYIQMGLLKVLPGTAIRGQAGEYGLIYCKEPPYQILANRWLEHRGVRKLYALGECVEAFYNNRYFSSIWQYLRNTNQEPFGFFQELLAVREQEEYAGLASTQELLTRILCRAAADRDDRQILLELLQYDWLRCGHRSLPDFFAAAPAEELRRTLWSELPQSMEGLYSHRDRSSFFKRSVFLRMSAGALRHTGLRSGEGDAVVCVLPEQSGGVIDHCRTILVEPL